MHAKDVLGQSGEQAAAEYLGSCGLRILDRNWRCAAGEIDIVAVDRRTLVEMMSIAAIDFADKREG